MIYLESNGCRACLGIKEFSSWADAAFGFL